MPVKQPKGQKQWDVKNGKAVLVTPAVKAVEQEVPVNRIDRELTRLIRRKERAAAQLAQAQTELDKLIQYEAELIALRATVPE